MRSMRKLKRNFWRDMQRQPVSSKRKPLKKQRMDRMRMVMKLN
jgi:hypothetical protein